jgi:hypothetical protein
VYSITRFWSKKPSDCLFGVASQHGVHPLDGADADAGHWVDLVVGQMLDVVELGELAVHVRDGEALELLQRLPAEVGAVDEEEHASRAAVADQAVADVRRGVRLAGAGRHLDQRARAVVGEGVLEVVDRSCLGGPEVVGGQRRQVLKEVTQGAIAAPAVLDSCGEGLGPVKGEDVAACRLGVEGVREARLDPGRLVCERQRAVERLRQIVGQAVDVLGGLPRDAGERLALLLGLEHADCLAVDVEEVVDAAVG